MKITTAFLTSLLFLVVVPSSIALDAIKMNVLPNESGKLVEASQMLGLNLGKQVPEGVSLDFHFKYDRGESPEEVLIILSAMFLGGGREMVQGASPRMQIRYPPVYAGREGDIEELPFNGKVGTSLRLWYDESTNAVIGTIDVIPGDPFGVYMFIRDQDRKHLRKIVLKPSNEILYPPSSI